MITANSLSLVRGGREVFSRLSFSLVSGEMLVLKGANGSGKSSILRGLAGFLPFKMGDCELPDFHYLGHENGLKNMLTLEENLIFWRDYYESDANIEAALAALNLYNLKYLTVSHLSQGQKRRLALAKLLTTPRPLWLLDEPQAGLDVQSHLLLEKLLASHLAKGGMVIMASHEAVNLPAKVLHMEDYSC